MRAKELVARLNGLIETLGDIEVKISPDDHGFIFPDFHISHVEVPPDLSKIIICG